MDNLAHKQKKQKTERCKSQRRQCKKLWDVRTLNLTRLTEGEINNITRQCRYLRLEVPEKAMLLKILKTTKETVNCDVPKTLACNEQEPPKTNILTHGKESLTYMNDVHLAPSSTKEPSVHETCSQDNLQQRGNCEQISVKEELFAVYKQKPTS